MNDSKLQPDQITLTEHLSALLDDEVGEFEQRRVLDELKSDDALSDKLSCYALIGESMRSESPQVSIGSDFLASIHDEIDSEPLYQDQESHKPRVEAQKVAKSPSWLRPVGGFAVAASVAAISVLGFQNYQKDLLPVGFQSEKPLALTETKSMMAVPANVMPAVNDIASVRTVTYQSADANMRSFLKPYVDQHMRHASITAFAPAVRVIANVGL